MKLSVREAKDKNSIIIMTGSFYLARYENKLDELNSIIRQYNNYVVKHCDKENIPTHICKEGSVNRYGILVSKNQLDFNEQDSIEFPKGKYKKESWISLEDLITYTDVMK